MLQKFSDYIYRFVKMSKKKLDNDFFCSLLNAHSSQPHKKIQSLKMFFPKNISPA